MSGQYLVRFHNQSSHSIRLEVDGKNTGCMHVTGPGSIELGSGSTRQISLIDSNHISIFGHSCTNKPKYITWNVSDRGSVRVYHHKDSSWWTQVNGDVTHAYCCGQDCLNNPVEASDEAVTVIEIYL